MGGYGHRAGVITLATSLPYKYRFAKMDQMENYCDKMSTTAGLAGPIYSPISSLPKQFDRNNIKVFSSHDVAV